MHQYSPIGLVAFFTISSYLFANELMLTSPASCVFSGTFKQSKSLSGLPTPVESSGIFFYHCDLGVVWKTVAPIQETLVLNRGGDGYQVKDGLQTRLASHQAKLLGELINGLIGGDQEYITAHFQVSGDPADSAGEPAGEGLVLLPKKRRIKRVFKRIELFLPTPDATTNQVSISMLDRNQQWTRIVSVKLADFGNDRDAMEHCSGHNTITAGECELLQAVSAP